MKRITVLVSLAILLVGAALSTAAAQDAGVGQSFAMSSNSLAMGEAKGPVAPDPAAAPAGDSGCDDGCFQPCWTVSAGAVILHRSPAREATLVTRRGSTDDLNMSDMDLGWSAGPRIGIVRHLDCGWDAEVIYFGMDSWNQTRLLEDEGNLSVPLFPFQRIYNAAWLQYGSRLFSTEFNLKKQCTERVRLLAGVRTLQLHEQFVAVAIGPDVQDAPTGDGVLARTNNYLYGFQIGSEIKLWDRCGPLRVDGFLKAGVYANSMRLNGRLIHDYDEPVRFGETRNRTSFVGEIGITASYKLNDCWSVFGGYEALWIDGVALAGDVPASGGSPDVIFNGDAFYHGAMAGIELTW